MFSKIKRWREREAVNGNVMSDTMIVDSTNAEY